MIKRPNGHVSMKQLCFTERKYKDIGMQGMEELFSECQAVCALRILHEVAS